MSGTVRTAAAVRQCRALGDHESLEAGSTAQHWTATTQRILAMAKQTTMDAVK